MSDIMKSIGSAVDLAKKALTVGEQLKNVELKATILDLMEKLIDVRAESIELREEIDRLKKQIDQVAALPTLELREGLYWKYSDPVPFCPACFEVRQKCFHLQDISESPSGSLGRYQCLSCEKFFGKPRPTRGAVGVVSQH